ncbi:MAG: hypothetical protein Q8O43_04320 [Dehalococcoidia bacterium]|nr:hypothetical protein [Dehalococcoidia bacterium]
MTDGKNETALTVRANNTALRNKTSQVSAIQRPEVGAADYVPPQAGGRLAPTVEREGQETMTVCSLLLNAPKTNLQPTLAADVARLSSLMQRAGFVENSNKGQRQFISYSTVFRIMRWAISKPYGSINSIIGKDSSSSAALSLINSLLTESNWFPNPSLTASLTIGVVSIIIFPMISDACFEPFTSLGKAMSTLNVSRAQVCILSNALERRFSRMAANAAIAMIKAAAALKTPLQLVTKLKTHAENELVSLVRSITMAITINRKNNRPRNIKPIGILNNNLLSFIDIGGIIPFFIYNNGELIKIQGRI